MGVPVRLESLTYVLVRQESLTYVDATSIQIS